MKEKITQQKLKARILNIDEELLTAAEEFYGTHTAEEWIDGRNHSRFSSIREYMEDMMLPDDGILGLYSPEQLNQNNQQQEKGNDK
ncbi:hypothetical protein A200_01000 [Parascardovia denticolens IPLA 20019]|uniref:hypothetical protein n=1 Tax=Parascardovia denticolens TaxID=78258 RepID=UPI000266BADB|nr:hypothetical protein [Parascardovia denticolens]EIT89033.1 hypothetical protein A200_01000 [Parascardovia denticolens IPLA 20019]